MDTLREQLAEVAAGKRFLLQGGDCAERFMDCAAEPIEKKLKILLQVRKFFFSDILLFLNEDKIKSISYISSFSTTWNSIWIYISYHFMKHLTLQVYVATVITYIKVNFANIIHFVSFSVPIRFNKMNYITIPFS